MALIFSPFSGPFQNFSGNNNDCTPAKLCWIVVIIAVITVIYAVVVMSNIAAGTFMQFMLPGGSVALVILGIIWSGIAYTYMHADACLSQPHIVAVY